MKIILASASPRRHELLAILGHDVTVVAPDIDELDGTEHTPEQTALLNAMSKARAVFHDVKSADAVIIAADTVVLVDNEVFGKPKNSDDARAMLTRLSGRAHDVITAYAIIGDDGVEVARSVLSSVTFRRLTSEEIASYLTSDEWRDKAGGYGVQGRAASLIAEVRGSLTNVIGLPIYEVMIDAAGFFSRKLATC